MASAATLTSSGGSDLGFVSDWNRESYWSVQPFSPQWVRLDFGATRVEANGVELWPGAMNAFFPRRYVLTASDGAEEAVMERLSVQRKKAMVSISKPTCPKARSAK